MPNSLLIQQTQSFVTYLFQSLPISILPYHNLDHTRKVVINAAELAQVMNLPPDQEEILLIAAWFHDTGYSIKYQGHEGASQSIARYFLKKRMVDQQSTNAVLQCIQATTMPQKPRNLMEEIICDADLAHLAGSDYLHLQDTLRREWEIHLGKVYSDPEWIAESLTFLKSHQFHTPFAKDNWVAGKLKNIQRLRIPVAR